MSFLWRRIRFLQNLTFVNENEKQHKLIFFFTVVLKRITIMSGHRRVSSDVLVMRKSQIIIFLDVGGWWCEKTLAPENQISEHICDYK